MAGRKMTRHEGMGGGIQEQGAAFFWHSREPETVDRDRGSYQDVPKMLLPTCTSGRSVCVRVGCWKSKQPGWLARLFVFLRGVV